MKFKEIMESRIDHAGYAKLLFRMSPTELDYDEFTDQVRGSVKNPKKYNIDVDVDKEYMNTIKTVSKLSDEDLEKVYGSYSELWN